MQSKTLFSNKPLIALFLSGSVVILAGCSDEHTPEMNDPEWNERPYNESDVLPPRDNMDPERQMDDPSGLDESTDQGTGQQY